MGHPPCPPPWVHPRMKSESHRKGPGCGWSFIRNASRGGNQSCRRTGGCFSFMKWNTLSGWDGLKSLPFPTNSRTVGGSSASPTAHLQCLVLLLMSRIIRVVACQLRHVPRTTLYPSSQSIPGWQLQTEQVMPASSRQKLDALILHLPLKKTHQAAIPNHATNAFPLPARSHCHCYSWG